MRIDRNPTLDPFRSSLNPLNRSAPLQKVGAQDLNALFSTTRQPLTAQGFIGTDPATWTYFDQDVVATDPNACGTTTLSMILATRGLIPPTLEAAKAVDDAVRRWGGFSAPDDLEKFAESKGLHSEGYNDQSFGDIKNHLGAGRSVMAMINGGSNPHWIAIQNVSEKNGQEFVTYADPADGATHTVTRQEFEAMWAKPMDSQGGFVNGLMNYKNFIQVFDSKPVPASNDFSIAYTQAAADGITDITNGGVDIGRVFTKGKIGGLISGPLGIVGGVVSTALAIPGAVGRIVEMGGDKVLDWAKSKWNEGGFGNKVLGGLGFVGGGILKGLGWGVKQIGNVVAKVGQKIGGAITKVGEKVGEVVNKVAEKVVDGVKKVGSAIASGVKKIFSGW